MKRIFLAGLLAVFFAGCGYSGEMDSSELYSAQNGVRYIITFDGPVNEASVKRQGGHVLKKLKLVNGLVVLLPNHAKAKLKKMKGVKSVELDARVFAHKLEKCQPWPECKNEPPPPPPPLPSQIMDWGMLRIKADLAWHTSTGAGIKIAIIDTGIDQDHSDLAENIKGGVNFTSKNPRKPADPNKWNDDNGHGTHVAGIVAALNNDIGTVGVAPNAWLYGVKALDKTGSGYYSDIIAGIEWAITNNMQVINMSLGGPSDVQALHDAVDAAEATGLVVVASAGNEGDEDPETNNVGYPAKYSSVIAVGATASDDLVPYWSSDGEEMEVSAPGVAIKSSCMGGGICEKMGTSMASPHIAGTVALMLASGMSPSLVRAKLKSTAEDLGLSGWDRYYGWGLIDAQSTVSP